MGINGIENLTDISACPFCHDTLDCQMCQGTGAVKNNTEDCPRCDGTGRCQECK